METRYLSSATEIPATTLAEATRTAKETNTPLSLREALRCTEEPVRAAAIASTQDLLQTLNQIAEKKRRIEATMALLLRETQMERRQRRWRLFKTAILTLILLWLFCATWDTGFMYVWVFIVPLSRGSAWAAERTSNQRRDAAYALSTAGDPRAIGVLALALNDDDSYVRYVAENALRRLLPRVRASDAAYITPDQMNTLIGLGFDHTRSQALKIALLKGLEQIGDVRALPLVEYLQTDASPQIRAAAWECMPFLIERMRHARESATLLRASAPTTDAAASHAHLLRPASDAMRQQTMPTDQLLRPVESHGAE
jgi:hypothetical protein